MSTVNTLTSTGQAAVNVGSTWTPPFWIPSVNDNDELVGYTKTEQKMDDPDVIGGVLKINRWLGVDLRFHDHPFDFNSRILNGKLVERRAIMIDGKVEFSDHTYVEGDVYFCPRDVVHMITYVKPGTISMMKCTPNIGSWSNYDANLNKIPASPNFLPNLRALNATLPVRF